MRYVTVVVCGFYLVGRGDVYQGEVLTLPAKEADLKIAQGLVRDSTPDEVADNVAASKKAAKNT